MHGSRSNTAVDNNIVQAYTYFHWLKIISIIVQTPPSIAIVLPN